MIVLKRINVNAILYDIFYIFRNSAGTVGTGPHSAPNIGVGKGKSSNMADHQSKLRTNGGSGSSSSLEQMSPWLVSSDALISSKKEKERSKIPQLKTVITTEL